MAGFAEQGKGGEGIVSMRMNCEPGIVSICRRLCLILLLLVVPGAGATVSQASAEQGAGALRASDFAMAGDENRTRIVLHFDQPVSPGWFLLRGPYRLVVDMPETVFAIDPDTTKPHGIVSIVRYGNFDRNHSRLIIGSDNPFIVERLEVMRDDGGTGHRLVVDLASASAQAFDALLADRAGLQRANQATSKGDRVAQKPPVASDRQFTVVLDPGHGGIDGGARGVSGTEEKTITLAFALELKKKIENIEKTRVFLTRDSDRFLRLSERVRIARQHEADLFISIHADTIRYRGVRGATVYTVSGKASDAMAEEIAASENLADRVAGLPSEQTRHEVTDILLDLLKRETKTYSIVFARSLVGEMSDTIEMIKNPHRFAGFQVLTAPDVPSVLVELGYLSNPKDEELMRDPTWRDRAGDSIAEAVAKYARARANGTGG